MSKVDYMVDSIGLVHDRIFDQGYAISTYDVCEDQQWFRYRDEVFKLMPGQVETTYLHGYKLDVARIEDVREAQKHGLRR